MYVARRRPTVLSVIAAMLAILVVLFLVIGWWRNWYGVSGDNDPGQVEMGVQINKEEVARDFGKLRDETERITESAQVAAELQTIEGTLTDVSAERITIREGDSQHSVAIDEVTEFYVGDTQSSLDNLSVGDPVRITFQESDGRKRASRVTVRQEEGT